MILPAAPEANLRLERWIAFFDIFSYNNL